MKSKYGYLGMTADFLHIGHIKAMKESLVYCNNLIIGLMTDECVKEYKGNFPIMDFQERKEVLESIKFIHKVVGQDSFEFPHHIIRLKEFYGDQFLIFDSTEHKRKGFDILIERTKGISSSDFKKICVF